MELTRRHFLHMAAAALTESVQSLRQEAGPRTVIETTNINIGQQSETFIGASVSQTTVCQVELLDPFRRRLRANEWTVQADTPIGGVAAPLRGGENATGVRITMTPSGVTTPSIAVAIVQTVDASGVASKGLAAGGRLQAANLARMARFIDDPARGPGRFMVNLPADGAVLLRIWRGEDASGAPLHRHEYLRVPQGRDIPIAWDLTVRGSRVAPGRYTAVLVCQPDNQALRPTNVISYFAVA